MDLEVHNALLYATARSRQVRTYSLLISNLILWKKYSLLLLAKFAVEFIEISVSSDFFI